MCSAIKQAVPPAPSANVVPELVWHGCDLVAWGARRGVGAVRVEEQQWYGRTVLSGTTCTSLQFLPSNSRRWSETVHRFRLGAEFAWWAAQWGVLCVPQAKMRPAWVNSLGCRCGRVIWEWRPSHSWSLAPHSGVQVLACGNYLSALACSLIASLMLWAVGCCKPEMLRGSFPTTGFMSEELIDEAFCIICVTICALDSHRLFSVQFADMPTRVWSYISRALLIAHIWLSL